MHSTHDRRRTCSLATRCYSLYTSPSLKGQNNSAQGSALGKGCREKPYALPAAGGGNSMNKANNSLRTPACRRQGIAELHFGKYETIIFVRK